MPATVSPTEVEIFEALRAVLLGLGLGSADPRSQPMEIVRGQAAGNRVPEPAGDDFIVMWPVGRNRLSTNIDSYVDAQAEGTVAGSVLTASAVTAGSLGPGLNVYGPGVTAGCAILRQTSGTPGGAGAYQLSPTADSAGPTFYAGYASLLLPTEVTVQLDVHGPASADNATIVQAFFRDEAGVEAFAAATPFDVTPLYADDPRQSPFLDDQQQYEERWIVDLHLQANPAVVVTQQFADELEIAAIPVGTIGRRDFVLNGDVLVVVSGAYPASPGAAGTFWSDGGVASIASPVPDFVPGGPALYFGDCSAEYLASVGSEFLPTAPAGLATGRLWNNGGVVCAAP